MSLDVNTHTKIWSRFKLISILIGLALMTNIPIQLLSESKDLRLWAHMSSLMALSIWLLCDNAILKTKKTFKISILYSLVAIIYGFTLHQFLPARPDKVLIAFSISPITLILFQYFIRKLFLVIFKKDPKVDRTGSFIDLIYTLILFLVTAVLPLILTDYIFKNNI